MWTPGWFFRAGIRLDFEESPKKFVQTRVVRDGTRAGVVQGERPIGSLAGEGEVRPGDSGGLSGASTWVMRTGRTVPLCPPNVGFWHIFRIIKVLHG